MWSGLVWSGPVRFGWVGYGTVWYGMGAVVPLDILFLQLPFWGTTCPPLGLACLKAAANEAGLETKCFDMNIELYQFAGKRYRKYWLLSEGYNYCESRKSVLEFYREFYGFMIAYRKRIYEWNPREIWITVQNSSSLFTWLLVQELKKDFKIVLGGPQIWEFEQSGLDINELFPGVSVSWPNEGEAFLTNKPFCKNLDFLSFPDFSDFDLSKYDNPGSLPIYFTRGCINRCIFCSERGLHGGIYRSRTGYRVFEDLRYQLKQHSEVYFFHFHDSISNGNTSELGYFCDYMIKAGLGKRVKWSMGNCAIRKEMRLSLYRKMKAAGCTFIGYGLETPVSNLARNVGKSLSSNVPITSVIREGCEAGIKMSLNFMFGLPGESDKNFEFTLDFLRRNRKWIYQVNPALNLCAFFPGSEVYRNPRKFGIELAQNPVLWSQGGNTYTKRLERFKRFVEEAKRLGLRNFFGLVSVDAADPLSFKPLYYTSSVSLIVDELPGLIWYLARLFAAFWSIAKRNLKDRLRKLYYLKGWKWKQR